MRNFWIAALLAACSIAVPAQAQHQTYAGEQDREIKALSADEVKQYLSGAGMGYAKAAELNRFPGPMHAVELAGKLGLTPDQRLATQQLMDAHKAEARAIGAELVVAEKRLDTLFRDGKVTQATLAAAVNGAAAIQGKYRLSHLETHRRMRALLTDEQVTRYDGLRGYAQPAADATHRH